MPIIEQGLKLDLRRLRRQGIFTPSNSETWTHLIWSNSATSEQIASCQVRYYAGHGKAWLRLSYQATPYGRAIREIDDLFDLEAFPQPFGGHRWYITCPATGDRCQCLYRPAGAYHFRSRRAFTTRLLYASQTQDWRSRLFERARREADKVLQRGPSEWRRQHADWDFPPKPPRMHWKTYACMLETWEEIEREADAILSGWILKLGND